MRYKPLKLSGMLFLFGIVGAQESANASGGDTSGSGGSDKLIGRTSGVSKPKGYHRFDHRGGTAAL